MEKEAVAAAASADVTLAMIGLSPELEGEEMTIQVEGFAGGDRTRYQASRGRRSICWSRWPRPAKPLVVVLLNGSAVSVNWANEHAAAILEAWYPGESGARAIAETLDGKNNPGGTSAGHVLRLARSASVVR